MELTLQLEQIWVFLQREGQGRWGVSCSINTCWIELLERQQGWGDWATLPPGSLEVVFPNSVPPTLCPLYNTSLELLIPLPPSVSFSLSKSLFPYSSWALGLKPSWWQRRGISMDVIARPVGCSLPHTLKAKGWFRRLVTRLIHGNSQCLGFCYDFVKKPDYLALGWDVNMGEKPRRSRWMLGVLSLQVDLYQIPSSAMMYSKGKQEN